LNEAMGIMRRGGGSRRIWRRIGARFEQPAFRGRAWSPKASSPRLRRLRTAETPFSCYSPRWKGSEVHSRSL